MSLQRLLLSTSLTAGMMPSHLVPRPRLQTTSSIFLLQNLNKFHSRFRLIRTAEHTQSRKALYMLRVLYISFAIKTGGIRSALYRVLKPGRQALAAAEPLRRTKKFGGGGGRRGEREGITRRTYFVFFDEEASHLPADLPPPFETKCTTAPTNNPQKNLRSPFSFFFFSGGENPLPVFPGELVSPYFWYFVRGRLIN